MCLAEVYTDEDMNAIVEGLPEVAPAIIEVFKVVCVVDKQYHSPNFDEFFVGGANRAKQPFIKADCSTKYYAGFHFWSSMKGAADSRESPFIRPLSRSVLDDLMAFRLGFRSFRATHVGVISCFVKKEWLTAAGKGQEIGDVLVASAAFFPTYPKTEARLEDFIQWLNENDLEWAESQLCEAGKK